MNIQSNFVSTSPFVGLLKKIHGTCAHLTSRHGWCASVMAAGDRHAATQHSSTTTACSLLRVVVQTAATASLTFTSPQTSLVQRPNRSSISPTHRLEHRRTIAEISPQHHHQLSNCLTHTLRLGCDYSNLSIYLLQHSRGRCPTLPPALHSQWVDPQSRPRSPSSRTQHHSKHRSSRCAI
jgi:hypothetical protein